MDSYCRGGRIEYLPIDQGPLEWVVPSYLLAIDGLMLITVMYRMGNGSERFSSVLKC